MKQRIITGVLAGALFVLAILIGGPIFYIGVTVLAVLAVTELLHMKKLKARSFPGLIGILLAIILVLPAELIKLFINDQAIKTDWIIISMLLLLSYTVLSKNKYTFDEAGFVLLSTLYVGIGFYFLNETRALPNGVRTVFFVISLIWATDTGAYFIGKLWGKKKLWPVISPNKTIEGSIGGVICAIVIAMIFQLIWPVADTFVFVILLALVISILGQVGDLAESALKRHYKVKDSGTILPGHGGMLDRFDSLLFVLPFLHILNLIS